MATKTASKKDTAKTVEAKEEVKDRFKYYYSPSASHMLGGYVPEKIYASGKIGQGDVAVEFKNHWVITDEAKMQKFIEGTVPFKNGYIKLKTRDKYLAFETRRNNRNLGQVVSKVETSSNYKSDPEYQDSMKYFEGEE